MRGMSEKRIYRIGLIVERSRAFGRELCEGVIGYAQERPDWEVYFVDAADLRRREVRVRMDGFVARVTSDKMAGLLASTGRPVVDLYYERPHHGFAIVKTRHETVGALAAEHFLDRRFTNFAYCPYGGGRTSAYCRTSFIRRLRRAGYGCSVYSLGREIAYDIDGSNLPSDRIAPPRDSRRLGKWLASLPKPVAVFTPGDLRAWQVVDTCRATGIDVPHEVAVLGLDNDVIICGSSKPMLSSVDPNTREIGRVAAETLAGMMERGIPARPVVRQVAPSGVVARASSETAPVEPPWLSDALVYIQRNARHGISASDVFKALSRSHTSVTRAFRETLGITVQGEIARTRICEAKRLLATTELSVTRIAKMAGFMSLSYFLQAFSAATGTAPGAWRAHQVRPVAAFSGAHSES
jgi:LacI family transcriptional regulator